MKNTFPDSVSHLHVCPADQHSKERGCVCVCVCVCVFAKQNERKEEKKKQ